MVDMTNAEEQVRGASDLMLELQQRLVDPHPQACPRPAVEPRVPPSSLPRENVPQRASTYEEQPNISPGKYVEKHTEPETHPSGNLGLDSRAGGVFSGLTPGPPRAAACGWQGKRAGAGGATGEIEAGGDGALRTQPFRLCTKGGVAAAAASTEITPSPRPASVLPLSIEVRAYPFDPPEKYETPWLSCKTQIDVGGNRETLRHPNEMHTKPREVGDFRVRHLPSETLYQREIRTLTPLAKSAEVCTLN